jgi:hypothetical protein
VRWGPALALLLPLLALADCASVARLTGLAAGGTAGVVTGNPALGYAIGVGVSIGVDELAAWIARSRVSGEQDAIAEAAGRAPLNAPQPWAIRHMIPIGDASGHLLVTREIETPIATCREVIFLVEDETRKQPFTTTLCRGAAGWRWAEAEPAVDRWGFLQRQ